MSTSKSTTESSSSARTGSIPSSYFQTEFPICCDGTSDIESSTISGTIVDESVDASENISMKISGLEKSLKKKVSISIQADRSIIGKEDSLPKERKRWIRPPVLGQASNNDNNAIVSTCESTNTSDSEQEQQSKSSVRSKQSDFNKDSDSKNKIDNIGDKALEGSSDHSLPPGGDSGDFQRIPTPSSVSSVTSRPLEWDSGADVGYFQQFDAAHRPEFELSSIERMALDRGRNGVLKRSDPEGKSSTKKLQSNSTIVNVIGIPTSESTPLSSSSVQYNSKKQNTSFDEKGKNNSKHQHLFPEIIIQKKGNESDSSCDVNKSRKFVCNEESQPNTSPLKKSSSLEDLNDSKLPDRQNSTFPRSYSHVNLPDNSVSMHNPQIEKIIHPPQSVSSSSIATVVTGTPHKTSKCIQTSYNKNNVATQSSVLNTGNHRNKSRVKKPSENNSSTLESIQMSAGDRVNSFEYLPGHIYENVQKSDDLNIWETGAISLRDDVERGVHLLEEFIQGSNANNTLMKKELIQRVVKRLIQTDYPEDGDSQNSIPLRCSTRRSQNRDEAIGESSSENMPPHKTKQSGNSTSLSGHSSSVWLSVTESSKSSEAIDSEVVNKKSAPPAKKKDANEGDKKPHSTTDDSTDTKLDWKAPITKAEKLYENKKKSGKTENENKLFEFLNAERENQLDWIVQEIDHLSNLKSLLEKHEKLRRNLQRLKKERQMKDGRTEDVRPTFHHRQHGFRRKPLLGSDIPNRPPPAPIYPKEKKITTEEQAWDSHNYDTTDKQKLKKSVSTETRKEDIFGHRRATAYTITFENDQPKKKEKEPPEKPLIADRQTLAKETRERVRETYHFPSLQDYLLVKRPDIVNRAEIRRKTVAELSAVRQLRQDKRPEVLAAALSSGNSLMPPPPPPLVKRIVSQKEMREQTEKKYRQTFEVKKKISEQKSRETLKTNRLMADMYNKRLQLLTLKGRTHLSNSIDVISTV